MNIEEKEKMEEKNLTYWQLWEKLQEVMRIIEIKIKEDVDKAAVSPITKDEWPSFRKFLSTRNISTGSYFSPTEVVRDFRMDQKLRDTMNKKNRK